MNCLCSLRMNSSLLLHCTCDKATPRTPFISLHSPSVSWSVLWTDWLGWENVPSAALSRIHSHTRAVRYPVHGNQTIQSTQSVGFTKCNRNGKAEDKGKSHASSNCFLLSVWWKFCSVGEESRRHVKCCLSGMGV